MNYHNITTDDMLNGDGLRVVLWVAGCTHRCEGCHNPVTWDAKGGLFFDSAAKNELMTELLKPHINGITFSGGDPLYPDNIGEITQLAKECKSRFQEKSIWLYTGYLYEDVDYLEVMEYVDVLVDGLFIQEQFDKKLFWRGSRNQRVIDVKATRREKGIVLHSS